VDVTTSPELLQRELDRLAEFDRRAGRTILGAVLTEIHQLTPEWPRDGKDSRRITARLVTDAWTLHVIAGGTVDDITSAVTNRLESQGQYPLGYPSVSDRGAMERADRTDTGPGRAAEPARPHVTQLCSSCGLPSVIGAGYIVHRPSCPELRQPVSVASS
jgi:hypothetical protein